MFKSILKNQKEVKVEKYIRKSLWQEVGSLQLTLDSKYVNKLLEISKGQSQSITKKLIEILFDDGPQSIAYISSDPSANPTLASNNSGSLPIAAEKSREIHQIICISLWRAIIHQSDQNEFLADFGLSLDEFLKLEPKAQKHLTDMCIELGEIYSKSPYGPKLEFFLQDYLKNTTFVERVSVVAQNPQFPTVSPGYTNWNLLPHDEIQKRLHHHSQVTTSTCNMFIEALNFNQGPLGNNHFARELHDALKQHKVDNDHLLTYTKLSDSGMDLLLKCSDKLLMAFKTLQDCVEQERLSLLEQNIGAEAYHDSTEILNHEALTNPRMNAAEKGKMAQ